MLGMNKKQDKPNIEQPKPDANKPMFSNPISQIFSPGNDATPVIPIDAQKIINEWLSKAHINMKTNLSQNQVNSICILASLGKQFKIKPLNDLIKNFLMFMISKDNESAKQLVNILSSRGLIDGKDFDLISKYSK
jgi:hypothetical protein